VFVCTGERVVRLERDPWRATTVLDGVAARAVAVDGARVLVGTQGDGAWLSRDGGASWEHVELPERDVFSVAVGAADGALYAGTEPSRLFVSRDGARWEELEALQAIPSRERWSFPPRPWTHHVRWIAPDPHRAERLLVGIELGGVMRSDDGGATFSDHRVGAKLDAHCLAWHPRAEGVAYQAAGDGAAWSRDGGLSWSAADSGRELRYCWALAVDPAEPERWYVSAASGPRAAHAGERASGRLYRWAGGWEALPLPGESMPYALAFSAGELVVGMADGQVLCGGADTGLRLEPIVALAAGGLRSALPRERAALEALQRRASLHNAGDREALLAHPDAIELPAEHVEHARVVERAGALAGFSVVLPGDDGAWELDGLFVEPELMGGGLGRALVDDAARIAGERGAASLAVVANPHALEFYRRVGFTGDEVIQTRFGPGYRLERRLSSSA
jgi:ribosomal protein S18 acetylase RimI-like enzyme